jgi:methyl-accepting chemotaxis protein
VPGQSRDRPHPFLWLLAAALGLALAAAALAPDRAPAFALYWNPIYRAEIALVVLAIAYLLGIAGWMAWNGQAFRRIELPGGAALERDATELDAAAEGLSGLLDALNERVDEVEAASSHLNDRVDQLEAGSTGTGSRVP